MLSRDVDLAKLVTFCDTPPGSTSSYSKQWQRVSISYIFCRRYLHDGMWLFNLRRERWQKQKIGISLKWFSFNLERRIIIIGKVGAGKSALGNEILKKDAFVSKQSFSSITDKWKSEFSVRNGIKYYVVDTPGVNGIKEDSLNAFKHLARCFLATAPGFHCIVLVISGLERLNDDDKKMVIDLDTMLGESAHRFIIIVFTGVAPHNLEALIDTSKDIRKLCTTCGNNYLSLGDNTDKLITAQQTSIFFNMLNKLFLRNLNKAYDHPSFNKAVDLLKGDVKKIQKEKKITYDEALDQARKNALLGQSSNDKELIKLFMEYKDLCPCPCKWWWLLCMFNRHRVCFRETYVFPKL